MIQLMGCFGHSSINNVTFRDKYVRVCEWQQAVGYTEVAYSPLKGHKYGVTCVKVSPQSTMLASASIDGTTVLWNLRTGSKIHTMVQPSGECVRVCRFSPDSTFLVTAGDNGQVCLWDLVRRSLIKCFQQHEGAVQGVAFTPDSKWLLSSCTFGVLNLFSVPGIVDSSVLNPNGNINVLATVDDAHDLGVVCCDFSIQQIVTSNYPLEKLYHLVTCGNDHFVKLWDVRVVQDKGDVNAVLASITLFRVLEKHSSALTCVRFSSNGAYIASCGLDKSIVIWETISAKSVAALIEHKRYVGCCAFSRDGSLLASGSNDRSIIVWDLTGNNLTIESKLIKHVSPIRHSSIDGDATPNEHEGRESNFVQFAESSANDVRLVRTLDDHGGAVNSVAFHGNNLLASGSGDKLVRIWELQEEENSNEEETLDANIKFTEKAFSPIDGHKYSINHVDFSPCGSMLASCSLDGTTMIWNTETGDQARGSFVNSGAGIRVCRWSPDGTKMATAGDDEKTTLWDMTSLEELQVLEGHADAVTTLAFTPDSLYIVTACSEGSWRVFDIERNSASNFLVCEAAHDLGVQGCDFSSAAAPFTVAGMRQSSTDDHSKFYVLATCGNDSLVKLWQITVLLNQTDEPDNEPVEEDSELGRLTANGVSYIEKKVLAGHGGNVMDVRFAPVHGEILGSVATDRTARLWSVNSGVCLHVLENHDSLVTSCAFSNDTSFFATGALDKTVTVWQLPHQLISQSNLIERLRNNRKKVIDWKTEDVLRWLSEINMAVLESRASLIHLNGRHLLTVTEEIIFERLHAYADQQILEEFKRQLYWLKREDSHRWENLEDIDLPHEFLCPITHEIMREPVQCSDGFIYEKAAINEWFLCGKYTSPMTNESLNDTSFTPAILLRNAIRALLHGEPSKS
ncbi:WD repeat, SAM and U-box domain-containing protein 1 [Diachasma alloeum]|uniref:WD repeat, SAM and U-box domain-containing protein 1 n=1 Tax=Diachasma alloeum TaxID=454923 RepID=UPI0007381482|nr:WD repeat, SAM and U-box domain-containing protein 1 [Diachasma alloeum]